MTEAKKANRLTLHDVERETDVLRELARILEPFDRDTQLRILESTCTLMRDDYYAAEFRKARQ